MPCPSAAALTDLVVSDRACDWLLRRKLEDLGLAGMASLIKNNIDHETEATFGSRENYLVSRQFPFSRRRFAPLPLIILLVSSQIFTSA